MPRRTLHSVPRGHAGHHRPPERLRQQPGMLASPVRFEIAFPAITSDDFLKSRMGTLSRNHVPGFVPTSDVRRHLVTTVRIIAFDSSGRDIRRIAVAGSRIRR